MSDAWEAETVPVVRVSDAAEAVAWYARLGFTEEWVHRFEPDLPAFVSIVLDGTGTRLFLSEHRGDAPPDGLVYLRVSDIAPIEAATGMRAKASAGRTELELRDPDGNRLIVGALGDPAQRRDEQYGYTLG